MPLKSVSPNRRGGVALEALHEAVEFALVLTLTDGSALVKLLFTARQSNVQFGASVVVDKERERNNRKSWGGGVVLQRPNLFLVQQQFTITTRGGIVVRPIFLLCDIHVLHPPLSAVVDAKSIAQRGFSCTDAFDFCACQHNACRVGVNHLKVESGAFVLYSNALRLLFSAFGLSYE